MAESAGEAAAGRSVESGRAEPVRRTSIAYLDGPRLRRGILAGARHVARMRSELDRINVFPVPDGDTGTNLSLTLRSVAEAVEPLRSRSVAVVAQAAAEASVLGARGNSGMLFSHFLIGFARSLGQRIRAGTSEISEALSAAASSLHEVLEHPREGTILTVARDVALEARRRAPGRPDLHLWLRDLQTAGMRSLRRTRELLPALREAGVVDAGAWGFLSFFDGVLRYIEGGVETQPEEPVPIDPRAPSLYVAREAGVGADEGRYCTQVALRTTAPHDNATIRRAIAGKGTSTIVLRAGNVVKVHIHADDPEAVISELSAIGEIVSRNIEDTALAGVTRHVAVITDSSADLPHEWIERHGVEVVPLRVIVGDRAYRDGVDLDAELLLELLTATGAGIPTTSQPPPHDFERRCRDVLDRGAESVLGVFVSSVLSGTYASGAVALEALEGVPSAAVDSRSGSLGVGLLVARAVELLDEGLAVHEVADELRRIRDRSNVLFTVDTLDHLLRSGRIGRTRAWLGRLLDYKPILTLDRQGQIVPAGRARGRSALIAHVMARLDPVLADANRYRLGVSHFGAPDTAALVSARLASRYDPVEILTGPTSAAIAVHTGPGAWAVAYQIED